MFVAGAGGHARAGIPHRQPDGWARLLFLHTDDFQRDYRDLTARGVRFVRPPKEESYGTVAVFEDLYGNLWDLLQLRDEVRPNPLKSEE